jgi:hypothetical protein
MYQHGIVPINYPSIQGTKASGQFAQAFYAVENALN